MEVLSIIKELYLIRYNLIIEATRMNLEHILPAYDDPLFSILLIIFIALIIALVTYGWGLYKHKKEKSELLNFLEKFENSKEKFDLEDMHFQENMLKPFSLLAKAFENSGEYPRAISLYLYLIENIEHKKERLEIMEQLANTYLHAGFLERARSIYLEILHLTPRNSKILYALGFIYESMHQYDKAKETLEPLRRLNEDIKTLENYYHFKSLMMQNNLDINEKVTLIKTLMSKDASFYREGILSLFVLDTKSAWEMIDVTYINELMDILWFLPSSQLDLDIIAADKTLHTFYYAKGYLTKEFLKSNIFTIDLLATARKAGIENGDLLFSYLCKQCKHSFPVSFSRCPHCMAINSIQIEEKIAESRPKTDYSLL
jgi:tetratricopeptide (TPR) repeat protein